LEGNATFEWWGRATFDGVSLGYEALAPTGEAELWQNFVDSINENNAR
jgi:alpha-glucuronidase